MRDRVAPAGGRGPCIGHGGPARAETAPARPAKRGDKERRATNGSRSRHRSMWPRGTRQTLGHLRENGPVTRRQRGRSSLEGVAGNDPIVALRGEATRGRAVVTVLRRSPYTQIALLTRNSPLPETKAASHLTTTQPPTPPRGRQRRRGRLRRVGPPCCRASRGRGGAGGRGDVGVVRADDLYLDQQASRRTAARTQTRSC